MNEFDFIHTYFSPLSGAGAFGLKDDVAVFADAVITKDVLVENVHFLSADPLDQVARKALRVNISDLVAKGCQPTHYFLGLVWPKEADEASIATFVKGLQADQTTFGVSLLGGDTTRHRLPNAPLTISVTMVGEKVGAGHIPRSGAGPGDAVMTIGSVGDAGLGLQMLQGTLPQDPAAIEAYRLPHPPLSMISTLARYATASLDISDGLMADAAHLAAASGLTVKINAPQIPLSAVGYDYVEKRGADSLIFLLTCGDDYQPLFTVAAENISAVQKAAQEHKVRVTKIGVCEEGPAHVVLQDEERNPIHFENKGYTHF
ncbi:MAG: thiamine-phosphate kinase [Pseudomonadota bacterium]